MTYSGRVNGINGQVLLKDEWVVEGNDGVPPIPKDVEGYTFAGWDDSYIAIKKDKDINTRYVKRQSDVKKERLEELRRSLLKLNLPKSVEVELMNLAEVLIEEEENGQNARSLALSFAVLMYIGALVSASAWAIFTADEEIWISWQDIEDAFQSCFVNPALIITIFGKAKADTAEKVAELESGEGDSESEEKLPNQGTVKGDVEGAPPVDAGKQGKHVQDHPNLQEGSSTWKTGKTGVRETQEGWMNGTELPDGTKVWDSGKPIGTNGETGVRVHIDKIGNIHGYPVDPWRYLPN